MNALTTTFALPLVLSFAILAHSQQQSSARLVPARQVSTTKPVVVAPCTQKSFVDSIAKNDSTGLLLQMHPALKRVVDQPVLDAWMGAMTEKFGPVKVLKVATETVDQLKTGTRLTSNATIEFEEGKASSKIQVLDGQLVSFQVNSPSLQDWFRGPTSTEMYEDLGSNFLRRFMQEENQQVADMCHAALRDKIEEPALTELMGRVKRETGELISVTLKNKSMEFKPNSQKLFLNYDLNCQENDVTCEVAIQFIGLKGYLVGFNFK